MLIDDLLFVGTTGSDRVTVRVLIGSTGLDWKAMIRLRLACEKNVTGGVR
jgi:hypothetical protein